MLVCHLCLDRIRPYIPGEGEVPICPTCRQQLKDMPHPMRMQRVSEFMANYEQQLLNDNLKLMVLEIRMLIEVARERTQSEFGEDDDDI